MTRLHRALFALWLVGVIAESLLLFGLLGFTDTAWITLGGFVFIVTAITALAWRG